MYSLKVKKSFTHPDGREFAEGHDCNALSIFEVAELLNSYPDNFEPGDALTEDLINQSEILQHYADAEKRQREELKKAEPKKVKK